MSHYTHRLVYLSTLIREASVLQKMVINIETQTGQDADSKRLWNVQPQKE